VTDAADAAAVPSHNLQRVPKRPADHRPVNPADPARLAPIGFTVSDYGE
jgi:hypothetical protein